MLMPDLSPYAVMWILWKNVPALIETLRLDPRPSYHDDSERIYGLSFSDFNVRFKVQGGVLTVVNVESLHHKSD